MLTIQVDKCLSSGLDHFYDRKIDTISVKNDGLEKGGNFGRVFAVNHIDGKKPTVPVVAKIFHEGREGNLPTVVKLQRKVTEEMQRLSEKGMLFFEVYPALLAVPQLSFEGTMESHPVKGFLSIDLEKAGFISSEEIFHHVKIDNEYWMDFMRRDLHARYIIAYSLASSCAFLRRIGFLHADITASNLFVSQFDAICALIDYDSGAFKTNNGYFPSTHGQYLGDWTAPEIINGSKDMTMTEAADNWSISVAIHHILTGFPAYLADDMSENTLKALKKEFGGEKYKEWPKFEPEKLCQNLKRAKKLYLQRYGMLDNRVKAVMAKNFTKGLHNPKERSDAAEWADLLKKCVNVFDFKYRHKWLQISDKEFPDIQSEKTLQIPKAWITSMHLDVPSNNKASEAKSQIKTPYDRWQKYIKLWVECALNGENLANHRDFIEKMASPVELKEEIKRDIYNKLVQWIENLKRCKNIGDNRSEVIGLHIQATILKIDDGTYEELRTLSKKQ